MTMMVTLPVDQLIRRLNLRDLRIFLTVVDRGNLAKAAASLSIMRTPPRPGFHVEGSSVSSNTGL